MKKFFSLSRSGNVEFCCVKWRNVEKVFKTTVLVHAFDLSKMDIINANTAILSNFEVLELLSGLRGKGDQPRNQSGSLATITYETIKYLEGTPAATQSDKCLKKFLNEVKKFGLTKKEKTMLLNLRPTTAVEISLIVQSAEQERLTEEQTEELIEIIQNILPAKTE